MPTSMVKTTIEVGISLFCLQRHYHQGHGPLGLPKSVQCGWYNIATGNSCTGKQSNVLPTSASAPTLLHNRYRILARLGQSRLAAVYRAYDERLQRPVLVHLLRPELVNQATLVERFLHEAQRGAQRSHPGLLEVFDSGDVDGRPYLITEDVTGRPLSDALPLPAAEAIEVLRTVISAVALAQSQGAPYPPVSSHNVWLLEGGRAVLLENWLLSPQETALDLAHYRAPERKQGAPLSAATVVYALGILSWETCTGCRPFSGVTADEIAEEQVRQPLPSLMDACPWLFTPGLDRVIACAAATDLSERYPAPSDFGRAIDLYLDQTMAHTGRLPQLPKPQPAAGSTSIFRRRSKTGSHVVPPPAPVLRQAPSLPRKRTSRPIQIVQAPQQIGSKELKHTGRWAMQRKGCQRALVRRSLQIVLIIVVLYAAIIGLDHAAAYVTGRVTQLHPGAWIAARLPHLPSLPQLGSLGSWRDIFGGLTAQQTLIVMQPLNMRTAPTVQGELLRELPSGTVLRRVDGPVDGDDASGLRWLKVVVVADGTEGWVADLPDRISQQ